MDEENTRFFGRGTSDRVLRHYSVSKLKGFGLYRSPSCFGFASGNTYRFVCVCVWRGVCMSAYVCGLVSLPFWGPEDRKHRQTFTLWGLHQRQGTFDIELRGRF